MPWAPEQIGFPLLNPVLASVDTPAKRLELLGARVSLAQRTLSQSPQLVPD